MFYFFNQTKHSFLVVSLQNIIKDYVNDDRTKQSADKDGKNFYKIILSNLERIGINENDFIKYICDDIYDYEKPTKFVEQLTKLLNV